MNDVIKSIINSLNLIQKQKCNYNINILTGKSISINKLFILLNKKINYKKKPIIKKMKLGDPVQSSGSTYRMTKIIKIKQQKLISINKGLNTVIDYLKND